jgi:protein gp37
MAAKTRISWADTTWPITVGCDKESEGCSGCYAMKDARRMESNPNSKVSSVYSDLVQKTPGGSLEWTGIIKTLPERLDAPKQWSENRLVFVCSQSDLFHPDVPADFIAQAFDVMWNYNQHRYLILTKRPERVLELMHSDAPAGLKDVNRGNFPHVRFGVSAENQPNADRRIPLLLQMEIDNFVSLEPLIGPIDVSPWITQLQWVIVGGESGKYARPMHPQWVRAIRDQCEQHQTLFHFKQWGEFLVEPFAHEKLLLQHRENETVLYKAGNSKADKSTRTLTKGDTTYYRVGRRKAGRTLDGRYWNARPEEDETPILAPHPIGSTVTIVNAGSEYDNLTGTIQTIQPDDPKNPDFNGEEASYYITANGHELDQAFGYWQLSPAGEQRHE